MTACAGTAMGDEAPNADYEFTESTVIVTDEILEDGETRTVRMVVETAPHVDGDDSSLCVFVPAGDEAGGALSCPGGNVRVFQFGPGFGEQFVIGDSVVSEEEIRALVAERIAEVNERLAEQQELRIEVLEAFSSEEFQRDMEELARDMEELHEDMRFEYGDVEDMTPEERAEFEEEMLEFHEEMAEFQVEMSELRVEAMAERAEALAEVAEEMAELRAEGIHVAPMPPMAPMTWFGGPHLDGHGRQVIEISRDGERQVTIIDREENEDGLPRIVIRTTDPSSVVVQRIDPDEIDDELED